MPPHNHITLLTDYGLEDGFVGVCHGVAARFAPDARALDVTHLVPPGDVRRATAVLAQAVPYLPPAVHIVVVDPGVGTARRAIAVEAGESILVGPDNGVLSWPIGRLGGPKRAHEITNRELWLHPVSATFHGRDIFVPVGAQLAAGLDLDEVGPAFPAEELVMLRRPASRLGVDDVEGEVVSVDRFGNVQLSITAEQLERLGLESGDRVVLELSRRTLAVPYRDTFASVPPDELVAYVDSAGLLAVAVNHGDASQRLGLPPGAVLRLTRAAP